MKSCPTCNRTFEDSFTFCLIDGSVLSAPFDPQATLHLPEPLGAELQRPAVPASTPQFTPTLSQVSPPDYPLRQKTTAASQPVRNTSQRLWIVGGVLMLIVLAVSSMVIAYYNTNSKESSRANSNNNSKQQNINRNEASRVSPSPNASSQTASANSQPSPTPLTAVRVKLRMFTEGSGGDFPNEEEVILQAGGQTFKKMSNSSGYVVFDNVPCGEEITIRHEGSEGPNQVIVNSVLGCDKPVVDFGMFNQFGKFTNKSAIRQ